MKVLSMLNGVGRGRRGMGLLQDFNLHKELKILVLVITPLGTFPFNSPL
jgi:hypothetical protein